MSGMEVNRIGQVPGPGDSIEKAPAIMDKPTLFPKALEGNGTVVPARVSGPGNSAEIAPAALTDPPTLFPKALEDVNNAKRAGKAAAAPTQIGDAQKALGTTWEETCDKYGIKFSKHATERLADRNMNIGNTELERLGSALQRAGEKGARESLVLLDELALVVSVKNRTVITALQSAQSGGVFTSIDSAVIA